MKKAMKVAGKANMNSLTVRIDKEIKDKITIAAEKESRSIGGLVRCILRQYCQKAQNANP